MQNIAKSRISKGFKIIKKCNKKIILKIEQIIRNNVIINEKGKIMDKLSDLLQEAKPLYKQRQRRKTIAKMVLTMTMPVIVMTSICQIYLQGNDIYLSLDNNILQNELIEDEFGLLGMHN